MRMNEVKTELEERERMIKEKLELEEEWADELEDARVQWKNAYDCKSTVCRKGISVGFGARTRMRMEIE